MSKLFFTSDTHFGHPRTLALSKRPFANVAEMDAALIQHWNQTVGDEDEVYHLGDVADFEHGDLANCLGRLRGRVHLVLGNNDDRQKMVESARFASISEMREIEVNGQKLFLCHYPLRDWPHAKRGGWHLFGHVHGRLNREPIGMSLDVGVDSHSFAPVEFTQIAQTLRAREQAARASSAAE